MSQRIKTLCSRVSAILVCAGLLALPAAARAQNVSGEASAIRATVFGATTALADTGRLADEADAREASAVTAAVASLGGAEALHATTISSVDGWAPGDSVASEASLANLALSVAGNSVSAAFVMARALAPLDGAGLGMTDVEGLAINGAPVPVTGEPNQVVWLLGGRLVINEQIASASGTAVNALHLVVNGIADVVVASAAAGIDSGGSSTPPSPPPLPPLPLPSLF
jgi:hypothetical protein